MSKSGKKKIRTLTSKKKVNRYTMDECNKELNRLTAMKDSFSKYMCEIINRKAVLERK